MFVYIITFLLFLLFGLVLAFALRKGYTCGCGGSKKTCDSGSSCEKKN